MSLEQTAQINESNAEFLTRLLSENGATYKVRDDTIYIDRIGSNESINSLETVSLRLQDCVSYDFSIQESELFQSAHAYFQDAAAGLTQKIEVSTGDPTFAFKEIFPDEDSAQRACEAFLTTRNRSRQERRASRLSADQRWWRAQNASCPGFLTRLMATIYKNLLPTAIRRGAGIA